MYIYLSCKYSNICIYKHTYVYIYICMYIYEFAVLKLHLYRFLYSHSNALSFISVCIRFLFADVYLHEYWCTCIYIFLQYNLANIKHHASITLSRSMRACVKNVYASTCTSMYSIYISKPARVIYTWYVHKVVHLVRCIKCSKRS